MRPRTLLAVALCAAACHSLRGWSPPSGPRPSRQAGELADASVPRGASLTDAGVDGGPSRVARLEPFGSEDAFGELVRRLQRASELRDRAREEQARRAAEAAQRGAQVPHDAGAPRRRSAPMSFGAEAPSPAPAAPAAAAPAESAAATVTPDTGASITNNQEQGVDEGDIVKARGDDILILRRGRLYSVRVGASGVVPKSVVSAAPPGVRPASWYDEMLVDGDTVLVLGYGYERRATEVNRFRLDASGVLTYRDTVLLRSGDYYSSRNYATRVVGHRLVLYTPVPMLEYAYEGGRTRWRPNAPAARALDGEWRPVADWSRVYRPLRKMGYMPIVHTVHFCDLSTPAFECRSAGVVGPYARTFYVSRRAVYLWVTSAPHDADPLAPTDDAYYRSQDPANTGAVVYRFPFDGGPVTAVLAGGGPIDQFSFRETADRLQVLVTADGHGDGMFGPEFTGGALGLYQIPLALFGPDVPAAPPSMLRRLPRMEQTHMLQNRFVGDHLLYGSGQTWWRAGAAPERRVFAHRIATGETAVVPMEHGVDRIEPMGRDAVVVGVNGRDLHLTSLALDDAARTAGHFVRPDAAQGETRSHGFFYLPSGDREGTLGLPLRRGGEQGWRQLTEGSAEVMFLRVRGLEFRHAGSLEARAPARGFDDRCVASCADWYGNARPIFYRGRVFALMGYELVEGAFTGDALGERARVNYFDALREEAVGAR